MRRILREPLLHFLLLGALLFGAYRWVDGEGARAPDQIVVPAERVRGLADQFQRTWLRPPTEPELDSLVQTFVREEVMYREGVARGLDRDDPIIRRRCRRGSTRMRISTRCRRATPSGRFISIRAVTTT